MSRSLWTIADLAWRQINPKGKEEAKNTLEEYVESAKDLYSDAAFRMWLDLRNDTDLSIIEALLYRKKYKVKANDDGLYSDLDVNVLDLPRDLGVFKVQPPNQTPLTKTTLGTYELFKDDPGEHVYYRVGKQIYYPEGFANPETKDVMITIVSSDFIDDELEVPDIFAANIREGLFKLYGASAGIPQDTTNNKNANE